MRRRKIETEGESTREIGGSERTKERDHKNRVMKRTMGGERDEIRERGREKKMKSSSSRERRERRVENEKAREGKKGRHDEEDRINIQKKKHQDRDLHLLVCSGRCCPCKRMTGT